MGTYRNRWGIEIKICCASCQYKDYDRKTGERICTLTQQPVERLDLCEEWHLSQGLAMAGAGGGEVKSKEYLREKFLECIISTKEKEPTIGYGHTKGVRMGDRISEQWAKELLKMDVQEVEEQVKALNVAHTEGQLDALVSFAFNLGITRLRHSTLLKLIREGARKNAIKQEFKRWVYARGRKLHGLELRREWEAKRFFE